MLLTTVSKTGKNIYIYIYINLTNARNIVSPPDKTQYKLNNCQKYSVPPDKDVGEHPTKVLFPPLQIERQHPTLLKHNLLQKVFLDF